jgi:twitching motility protein PilU
VYAAGAISYEESLRNADSKNEVRLRIKLESKREMKLSDEGASSLHIIEDKEGFGR